MKTAAHCKTCRHALVCSPPSAIVLCDLSGLLSACGPDASFFLVPLLFLSHLQGGSTWRRGHLPRLSFVCLFLHSSAARRVNIFRSILTLHHRFTRDFFSTNFYLLVCISSFSHLTDLISLLKMIKILKMTYPRNRSPFAFTAPLFFSLVPCLTNCYRQKFSPRREMDCLFLLSSPPLLWLSLPKAERAQLCLTVDQPSPTQHASVYQRAQ